MNKLLTTFCSAFFLIEAVVISIFLLDITMNVEKIIPWIVVGSVNLAFLFVLISALLDNK